MAKKPKKISPETIATVNRLWVGGEKANAIGVATSEGVPASDWPDGMAEFKREARL